MKRSKVLFFIAALALGACRQKDDLIKPVYKSLTEAVYASGYVRAIDEYEVYAQAEGAIADKLVNDGESIKAGQPLFIIDASQQSSRYRIASETFTLAQKNAREDSPVLSELKAMVETSRTKMKYDSVNAVRYTNLWGQQATTRAEYDRMKLAYENSKNDLALQQNRYAKTKNQLALDLQTAKNQLEISGEESQRFIVRSDVDGMVFKTFKDRGELIRRNELIAVVGNKNSFYLELSVDERDIEKIREQQEVVAKIDAYPGKIFTARVTRIYPLVNQQQQSFRVDATFAGELPGAFSGLAVEANIIIQKKSKALVVPRSVLQDGDSVWIVSDDGDKKQKVITGLQTLDEVEIVSGADSTQRIRIRN